MRVVDAFYLNLVLSEGTEQCLSLGQLAFAGHWVIHQSRAEITSVNLAQFHLCFDHLCRSGKGRVAAVCMQQQYESSSIMSAAAATV